MLQHNVYRRTKTVCSLRPSAFSADIVDELRDNPPDSIRLIYEPTDFSASFEILHHFMNARTHRSPSVMVDLSPKCRAVSGNEEPLELGFGQKLVLGHEQSKSKVDLKVKTEQWSEVFAENVLVYFAYGKVILRLSEVSADRANAEVVLGGVVVPTMDIEVPATHPLLSLAQFDDEQLKKVLQLGAEYLITPGGVSASDVTRLQKLSQEIACEMPWLILKVDSLKVYEKLDQLMDLVHGIFVSRMELALTMDPAIIPLVTKETIERCNQNAKLTLVASEMLGSMRYNPTPTRAEVSDIANAVRDGADAVVLSEDISQGRFLGKAIGLSGRIIVDIESGADDLRNWTKKVPEVRNEMDGVSYGSLKTAERVGARAIVCLTRAGNTALKLASFQVDIPIVAVTFSESVQKRLSLVRGVSSVLLKTDPVLDQVLPVVNDLLIRDSWLKVGDKIVFVTVTLSPLGRESSNLFTVQTLI